ncbi:transglutaminase family protein [Stappia sp.]|jgi:transglutaminase-like putative cysteine protease|uniref:transglutaminase family protein n=1 Tax=Stappia sp. TaxID=1870903 RepID=UPI003A992C2C
MRLVVKHVTRYRYDQPIAHMVQQLRLTPPDMPAQKVRSWRVEVPGYSKAPFYTDAFGNRVDVISYRDPVDELVITVEGVVDTEDTAGVVGDIGDPAPEAVYLRLTPLTRPNPAIRRLAGLLGGEDAVAGCHALMEAIRDKVAYVTGVTEVNTTAAEAMAAGHGVCQDHAHIFISAARVAGFPARYVSGYMLLAEEQESEAHHAWAEVKVPGLGWVGFDVSNGMCPTDRYIRLTTGLDSRSAAPIRGVRAGGGLGEDMNVEVAVNREQAQAQQ